MMGHWRQERVSEGRPGFGLLRLRWSARFVVCLCVGPKEQGDTSLRHWPLLPCWEGGGNRKIFAAFTIHSCTKCKNECQAFPCELIKAVTGEGFLFCFVFNNPCYPEQELESYLFSSAFHLRGWGVFQEEKAIPAFHSWNTRAHRVTLLLLTYGSHFLKYAAESSEEQFNVANRKWASLDKGIQNSKIRINLKSTNLSWTA